MEIGIIIALSLTVLILLFSLIRQSNDVRRLKRLEPEVVRLQTRLSEDVHKASNFEAEVTRLQTALSKEKQHNKRLRAEAINPQNKTPSANFKTAPPPIYYTDYYWQALSAWYRQEQSWTCECCGINLRESPFFLHTHHVLGRRYNAPEHLKALCIKCHAEQKEPVDHSFMKGWSEYKRFVRKFK